MSVEVLGKIGKNIHRGLRFNPEISRLINRSVSHATTEKHPRHIQEENVTMDLRE
jgi:hypothetical protein